MTCDYKKALELAHAGQWEEAHHSVQKHSDELACLIHGYLHRIEGDLSNAQYWYRRGNASLPNNSLEEEYARLRALADQA